MKQYKVFKHPLGTLDAVKQGWSWPAFSFLIVWAMVKQMWGLGSAVLVSALLFGFILGFTDSGGNDDALINIVFIIVSIIFGVSGNSWRERHLLGRGYEQVDTVTAANPEGALALYVKSASKP